MTAKQRVAIISALFISTWSYCQKSNWQNLDLETDSVFGISTEKAYDLVLTGKKSTTVIVAVLDAGMDTSHEDLKEVLWTNLKEKPNGRDDDKNGYIDDRHGWNFIGGANGNVEYDNLDLTRLIRAKKGFYDSLSYTAVPANYQKEYQAYRKISAEYRDLLQKARANYEGYSKFKTILEHITAKMGKETPGMDDFINYEPVSDDEQKVKDVVIAQLKLDSDFPLFKAKQVDEPYSYYKDQLDYGLNVNYDPRSIVGDNYEDTLERYYGNADLSGADPTHGTHVAGIIGAIRNNNLGIKGVADNVLLMVIRVVPKGDERDKDVANAIRYAVDNGAKIINMSFGKPFSPHKGLVDEAVKYAMKKDVLIIHGAGNDAKNLDNEEYPFFPNKYYADGSGEAAAWINVGASGRKDDNTLVAPFSNFGKKTVDVFAPGVEIYSTVPGSQYKLESGTSMAAPVVTGLGALIREYYPKLSAIQVKEIILNSVVKRDILKDKCVTGGIVNAYNALKLAASFK